MPIFLFVAVCSILLGVLWNPIGHIMTKLYGLFNWNTQIFFCWLLLAFVVINMISVSFSLLFIKNRHSVIQFNVVSMTMIFAIFFSIVLIYLSQMCYI